MRKLSSQTLPWPTDWGALFGARRPLILEFGFGYGSYLYHLAVQNPGANIVGLEVSNRCLTAVEKGIERRGYRHVRVIHSTAETALHHLFEPATIAAVHINFPDPWFKKRHKHRRLMRRETLDVLVNRMKPGATLQLATDIDEYAALSAELLAATPGLDNLLEAPWLHEVAGRAVTKYERKARRAGRLCYYLVYRRNTTPAPDIPVIRDWPMPHIVFKSPLSQSEMLARFEPGKQHHGDSSIHFMYGYAGDHALLFEVYVKEPTIDQHIAIILMQREEADEYTLKLSSLGHPRPTAGVHRAVALLGAWLVELHPGTQVLERKLRA